MESPSEIKHESLLIVEDERIEAMFLERMLRKQGYESIHVVQSGEEALTYRRENHVDCVFMDIILDGQIDGVEAAAQIQRLYGTPIIFCTGNSDPLTLERASSLNPLGICIKPIKTNKLLELLEHNF